VSRPAGGHIARDGRRAGCGWIAGTRMLVALLLGAWVGAAWPAVIEFARMQRSMPSATSTTTTATTATTTIPPSPPGEGGAGAAAWTGVDLPDAVASPGLPSSRALWYRSDFDIAPVAGAMSPWVLCLPFLYEGGDVWINGVLAGSVPASTPAVRVRWERPHLIPLAPGLLRPGRNEVAVRVGDLLEPGLRHFPRLVIGSEAEVRPRADRRTFWVRTMPQITVVVCLLVSGFVLFIYWRRPGERLYGLFGLASALWGVRTLTFVVERMPVENWHLWRVAYHAATGGFIVVLALFALRFAAIHRPATKRALLAYWLVGPLWLWWAGPGQEGWVGRVWTAGLIPIGLAILWLSVRTMWRQRTFAAAVMPATLVVAVLVGLHDYLLAWNAGALARVLPHGWVDQRIFLLHHGANLVLLGMGGLLTARFLQALSLLESANGRLADLNDTLESRVARRERRLAENFERMAELQRESAAAQERQLIMREIHDGLGSRLFTSLLRVERGDMDRQQIAGALRDCIADMRLALEVLAPDDDLQAALSNFLFRWQTQLRDARVAFDWSVDVEPEHLALSRQQGLQLLRIAQEALTNVLKHADARRVHVELRRCGDRLELVVGDDGHGAGAPAHRPGRGIVNMQARARQLGGELTWHSGAGGTVVRLSVPLGPPGPSAEGEGEGETRRDAVSAAPPA
jgi:signal transduction histidine kinase